MSPDGLPRLALCPGEPAGIGPDIVLGAAARSFPARIVCFADPEVMGDRAAALGLGVTLRRCANADDIPPHEPGSLAVVPVPAASAVEAGSVDPRNARYVLDCLDRAVDAARTRAVDCIVTGPVHKGVINDAGYAFSGHTEYLAQACENRPTPVMMLIAGELRVALVTTHLALRDVPAAIDTNLVAYTIETVASSLRHRFGIARPRIAVCGLNPHAGEGGHFGSEETDIIAPAIAAVRNCGADLIGPLPADTAFAPHLRASTDAYVTMFHDQGLPVIKAIGFGEIVNVTLGLPLLRTSVDHGTALELAGTGRARCESLEAALNEGIRLSATAPS